jgi:hypothetical protein
VTDTTAHSRERKEPNINLRRYEVVVESGRVKVIL